MNLKSEKLNFEKSAVFMLVMSVIASGFNYLFQIIAGRILSKEDYGTLNSVFSVVNIVTVIGVALGLSIAKNISENSEKIGGKTKSILKICAFVCPVFFAAVFFAMKLMDYNTSTSIMTAVATFFVSVSYVFHGTLQGKQMFSIVGVFGVIMPAIKCVAGTALLVLNFGLDSALAAITIGSLLSMVFAFVSLKKNIDFSEKAVKFSEVSPIFVFLVFTLVSSLIFVFYNNIDILLVRRYFSEYDVGIYSCSALFGKIILYIPAILTTIMFPKAAQNRKDKSILVKTLGYSFLISFAASVILYLLRNFIIKIIMGAEFEPAGEYILPLIAEILPLVLITVLVNYLIARSDKWFVTAACVISVAFIIAAAHFFHSDIKILLLSLSAVYCGLFIILLIRGLKKDA